MIWFDTRQCECFVSVHGFVATWRVNKESTPRDSNKIKSYKTQSCFNLYDIIQPYNFRQCKLDRFKINIQLSTYSNGILFMSVNSHPESICFTLIWKAIITHCFSEPYWFFRAGPYCFRSTINKLTSGCGFVMSTRFLMDSSKKLLF